MEQRGETPALPPVTARHLVDWWLEIGPTVPTGMGDAPVGWADMDAWQRVNGVGLEPWEARTIRAMSSAFIGMRHDARKSGCPAPYSVETTQEIDDRVGRQFAALAASVANWPERGK